MDIREFFFWTASIALILMGLFVITLFAFLFYIKRLANRTAVKILERVDSTSKIWRNLTLTRFVIRTLRYIF